MTTESFPDTEVNDESLAAFFAGIEEAFPNANTIQGTKRLSRSYDVFVKNTQNEIVIEAHNISASYAGRLRNEYRHKHGYRVDQLEVGTNGEVHRIPDEPIDYTPTVSTVTDKPFVPDKGMKQREINFLRNQSQEILTQANAKLAKKSTDKTIRVYDKLSGKLSYAGTIEGAVKYIKWQQEFGNWTDNSWVIYIPEKIYNQVVNNV